MWYECETSSAYPLSSAILAIERYVDGLPTPALSSSLIKEAWLYLAGGSVVCFLISILLTSTIWPNSSSVNFKSLKRTSESSW